MSETEDPFSPRRPPHITVNSGSGGDIAASPFSDSANSITSPGSTRQLLGPQAGGTGSKPPGSPLYGSPGLAAESAEMLLPPSRSKGPRPYRDITSNDYSSQSVSSRRSSLSSERSSGIGPFISPFDDSRTPSRAGSSDDEGVNTQTVSEKYNITPSAGLLLYPEDVEKDDWLHNPDPGDKDGLTCDIWNRRSAVNLGGLVLLAAGVLFLFIGYPILTYAREITATVVSCATDPQCLSSDFGLLTNQRTGLIDPHTPDSAKTKTSYDGKTLNLVFSDEFNTDGRTFYSNDDPYFEAVDIWYGVTQDHEWYDPDAVTTENGTLVLRFDAFQSHNLNFRSGMVQSWNKLCFKGGRMEASISLPGSGAVEGFWPGWWAMGNLGRPGYPATTDGLWPYSYGDQCDAGITKNQSDPNGLSMLPGMRLPSCTCADQDHPNQGKSRSAPEIDGIEASVGFMGPAQYGGATGTASQSLQLAPFDIWYQPDADYLAIFDRSVTMLNAYRGGPYQEAISGVTWLNNDWYDGAGYQTYGFEYTPGETGDVTWFVGDEYTWHVDHRAVRPNGNIGQRVIPQEPMALIMNFGMSDSFAEVFMADLVAEMPAHMRFDYVRIYQDPDDTSSSVTCDPPDFPTTDYISNHPKAYLNPNKTLWSDTSYDWPTNTFVDGCTA